MKQFSLIFGGLMCNAALVLILSGCMSIPVSPQSRLYLLKASVEKGDSKPVTGAVGLVVGVGPVKVPAYLNRPQMVTCSTDKMIKLAQFDRWGEVLDTGLMRVISEGLAARLPGAAFAAYPWHSALPVKYQVVIEIVQLDSELDKELFLVAQWLVIDAQSLRTLIIKRSEFRRPIIPQDYAGLARTLSDVCASLSREIAEQLATMQGPVPPV